MGRKHNGTPPAVTNKFHGEYIVFLQGEDMSFPGLTLKRAPRSTMMAPFYRTHTTSYQCFIVTLAVNVNVNLYSASSQKVPLMRSKYQSMCISYRLCATVEFTSK